MSLKSRDGTQRKRSRGGGGSGPRYPTVAVSLGGVFKIAPRLKGWAGISEKRNVPPTPETLKRKTRQRGTPLKLGLLRATFAATAKNKSAGAETQ